MNLSLPHFSPGATVVPVIEWMNIHWHPFFAAVTHGVEALLKSVMAVLMLLPPYGLIAVAGILTLLLAGVRTALLVVCALGFFWAIDFWAESMQTITMVTISVCISLLIAFPLGVLAARYRGLEAAFRPVLDVMQTVPPWVYLIPAVIIFSLGSVPAIIATIIYSTPPMVRITTLAFKQIPQEFLELGAALGARPRTILFKIEIPAARPTLLVGVNQCILLSLAMVVLAGLVGASGLGAEVTRGLTRMQMGLGLRSGLGIVAVAILLDRLSRAAFDRKPQRVL